MRDTSPDRDSGVRSEPEARRRVRADGGEQLQAHTVRLELVDEPGELLRALEPIASHGGNLLSIFHQRGSLTPRGHIPVEIDLECPPGRLDTIVEALRENGVNVIQTDVERYRERVTVVLVGDLVETDLSDTLARVEEGPNATVVDMSLAAPNGADVASARLSLAAAGGAVTDALDRVREVAEEKNLRVVEPLVGGSA
jgi:ACT domain-containing protein